MNHACRRSSFAILVVGLVLVFNSTGCGPGEKDRGMVHGKVTLGGKPVPMGTVIFVTSDNRTATANIKEDGTYEVNAPAGEVMVAVHGPASASMGGKGGMMPPAGMKMPGGGPGGAMKMPGGMSTGGASKEKKAVTAPKGAIGGGDGQEMSLPPAYDPAKMVTIPEKYTNHETSGLTLKVTKNGDHTFDIPLTP